jgi:hypothetical protein
MIAALALYALLSTGEVDLHAAAEMTGDVGEIAYELRSLVREADEHGWVAVEDASDVRETLAALLQAVRDIVDGRVNELVDGQTRTRLEHWFDGVSTPDKQDTTWGLRRLRYLSTGQHVKHVSIVSLVNGAEVCVEQVAGSGDDHAPTQLWRVGLITPDGMGDAWCFGRPSAVEVDSAHDAVCVLMQLNVEAEEATLA